jgi:hypothetical protein
LAKDTIDPMQRLLTLLRSPFSFLFASSGAEDRVAAYVVREHGRGRSLNDILDDPYVRNRLSDEQRRRLLDRPEVIRAVGNDVIAELRAGV